MTSTHPPAPDSGQGISRRRLAAGAAWTVPAVLVASAAPAHAASPTCGDTNLQPFPEPIRLYDKNDNEPAHINILPHTANGWTARTVGRIDKGGFSYSNFDGGGFRTTLDPIRRTGEQIETFIEAFATTIVGCSYTLVSTYELSGVTNDRPLVARLQVDGVGSGTQVNSNNSPVTGSITTTFVATSTSTKIGLWTRVTGTDNANGGADINMSQPIITCDCPS